jgi:hypothetical protein
LKKVSLIVIVCLVFTFLSNQSRAFAYADCIHPANSTSYDEYYAICVLGQPEPYSPTPTPTPAPTGAPDTIAPSAPANVIYYVGASGNGDPLVAVSWDSNPESGIKYFLYVDGVKYNNVPMNGLGINYYGTGDHVFKVSSVDPSGNESSQTLAIEYVSPSSPTPTPTGTSTPTATPAPTTTPEPTATPQPTPCPECVSLSNLLACPEWSTYMGQLTNAIAAAIPPPPDWDMVADKIGNAFITKLSDYMGQVPAIPTVAQIKTNVDTSLPTVDNSSSVAQNLVPTAAEFNAPQNFDLSDAPVIPIVDNSRPFIITEPLSNITFDDPNIPVFPNDARNNSGGIETPTAITGGMPTPINTGSPADPIPTPNGSAAPPNDPIPTPQLDSGGYSGSIPNSTTGDIPIPSIIP